MRAVAGRMAAGALCAALLASCYLDGGTGTSAGNTVTKNDKPNGTGQNDGTGTGAGNTIVARVLTLDGAPAAGATVYLRPEGFIPDSVVATSDTLPLQGVRQGLTDSLGRISLPADTGVTYVLEVGRASGGIRQVAWREFLRLQGKDSVLSLGDIGLGQSATLAGAIRVRSGGSAGPKGIWVGFPGTSAFAHVGPDGTFLLPGLPSGNRELSIFRHLVLNMWERIPVRGWRVFAGSQSRLDSLVLPDPGAGTMGQPNGIRISDNALSAAACKEDAGDLVRDDYLGPSLGGARRVLRAWMNTPAPAWVELDPCLGSWRKVADMPPDAAMGAGTFSAGMEDFVQLIGSKQIRKLDSAGNLVGSFATMPYREVEFYEGRYYAFKPDNRMLRTFPNLQAIVDGKALDSLDMGEPYPSVTDMAIEDSVVYLATASVGDPLRYLLRGFDLRSRRYLQSISMPSPGGPFMGMTGAGAGRMWVLDAGNQITLLQLPPTGAAPSAPVVLQRIKVGGAAVLSGLTRFRESGIAADAALPSLKVPAQPTDPVTDTLAADKPDSLGCYENRNAIVQNQYAGLPRSGKATVLRTYVEGAATEWVELDPCQATWRTLSPMLREPMKGIGTFSNWTHDYFGAFDRGAALRYDSLANFQASHPLPAKVGDVEFYLGKYYAVLTTDAWLHEYADSAAFWSGKSPAKIPGMQFPFASTWDIAIVEGIIYWAAANTSAASPALSDTVALNRYDLARNQALPAIRIGGFKGAPMGIASGSDGRLWLLDAANTVFRLDMRAATYATPTAWKLERKLTTKFADATAKMYGLTRFRDEALAEMPSRSPVVPASPAYPSANP